jgi:acyl-coenzyme A synthetase/AMP-(fatty) acid ligase
MSKEVYWHLPGFCFHKPLWLALADLMKEYEAAPIAYGNEKSSEGSIILHTTGTVSGIHKPVPMSDKALNSFVIAALEAKDTYEDFKHVPDHLVSFLALPLSWVYAMVDMLHTAFGLGMEVVCLPFGATNPRYADAIENYGISILFTSMGILDTWNKMMPDVDLSKVKVVFMGGTYVSPEFKRASTNICGPTAPPPGLSTATGCPNWAAPASSRLPIGTMTPSGSRCPDTK